jgi:hypothetical protein
VWRVPRNADDARPRRLTRGMLVRLAIAGLALAGMAVAVVSQLHKLPDIQWKFSLPWLLAGILAFVAIQAPMAVVWVHLVRRLGGELPTPRGRSIWCVSLLGRYVPTGALMIVGRLDMGRRAGVPRRICMASIVYEMALTLGVAFVACAGFVVSLHDLAPAPVRWAAPFVGVAALAGLHPRIFRPVADRLLARAGAEPLPAVLSPGEVARFGAAYVGYFVVLGLGTLAMARALHPVSASDAPLVMASFAVGFIASVIGFLSPGGLGAREVAQATALVAALPFAAAGTSISTTLIAPILAPRPIRMPPRICA